MKLGITESPTVWMWVQEFGPIHFRGQVIDCDAEEDDFDRHKLTAATAEKSLRDWYANYQPALIREHEHVGHSFGVATGETRRLTPKQMRALITPDTLPEHAAKLRAQSRDVFFAEFRLTDPATAQQHSRRQLLYTSPHVQVGHTDNTGRRWALVHRENSLTTGPVQTSQVPIPALAEARLSHSTERMEDTSKAPEPVMEEGEEMAEEADRVSALEAQIETLAAQLTEIREMVEGGKMAEEPKGEPDQPTDEVAELRASLAAAEKVIAGMTADKRRDDATAEVARLSLTASAREELIALAASNPEGYALSIKHVPALTADQPTGAAPEPGIEVGAPVDVTTPIGEHSAILSIQSEARRDGVALSYTEARAKLARKTEV